MEVFANKNNKLKYFKNFNDFMLYLRRIKVIM